MILTRKRLFTQATKNLEKAKKIWDGEESELAQVGLWGLGSVASRGVGCSGISLPRCLDRGELL